MIANKQAAILRGLFGQLFPRGSPGCKSANPRVQRTHMEDLVHTSARIEELAELIAKKHVHASAERLVEDMRWQWKRSGELMRQGEAE